MHPFDVLDAWQAAQRAAYAAVTDPQVNAVLDVLAPRDQDGDRWPLMAWPKEETPTGADMVGLAERIVVAVRGARPTR